MTVGSPQRNSRRHEIVIWLVGLSASGKTTLGHAIVTRLRAEGRSIVMMDGDEMRRILGRSDPAADYGIEARRSLVARYQQMCAWLDGQGVDVVCCVIGMFPDLLRNNRELYGEYFEIFLDAPIEVLAERDPKGIYRRALAGRMSDVVGVDLHCDDPDQPDLRIPVSTDMPSAETLAETVLTLLPTR